MSGRPKAKAVVYKVHEPSLGGLALVRIEANDIGMDLLAALNGIGFDGKSDPGPCTTLSAILHAWDLHGGPMKRVRRPELIALMLVYGVNQLRELPKISKFTVAYALGKPSEILDTVEKLYDVEVSEEKLECSAEDIAVVASRAASML